MNKINVSHILLVYLNLFLWLFTIYHLAKLQIIKAADYDEEIEKLEISKIIIPKRGNIYVKDKNEDLYLIATVKKVYDLYFNPIKSNNIHSNLKEISKIIKKEIKIDKGSKTSLIAKNLDKNIADEIKKLKLDSVFFEEKYIRIYPEKTFLSPVLGFASLNENNILEGRYGIEKFYDNFLKGEAGIYYEFGKVQNEVSGADIILNIDYFLQKYAEKILEEGVKAYKAEGGLIIIAKNTGEILVSAEEPKFDLNKFNEIEDYNLYLTKLIKNYEPGSILKSITFFSGLNENVYKSEDKYFDNGKIEIDNWTIYNFDKKARGEITLAYAFEHSLNTGAVYIEKLLGHSKFLSYLKKFRLDKKPGIDLPNLSEGDIQNLEKSSKDLRDVNFATASFGHGISISPIHLLMAFSVFANEGKMHNFLFVDKIIMPNEKIKKQKTNILSTIGYKKSIEEFNYLLERVTLQGSGKKTKTLGYRIGGKTGSAFIPYEDKPGYSEDLINTYVAIFPLTNPKFIIFIRIDKPQLGLARVTTVPLAKKMIDFLINYYSIQQDDENSINSFYLNNQ